MIQKIFVNLPVKDLEASKAFFAALGYGFDLRFCDETAACMVVSEHIFVMLLTHEKFKIFTPREIADATKVSEVLTCLSVETREGVDALMGKALAGGGTEVIPQQPMDMSFMYGRAYADLDGHIWEIMWMDVAQMMAQYAD